MWLHRCLADDIDQVTLVVPDSSCIIESITSDSLLQIAKQFGWRTEKRSILYEELPNFTEILADGTAASVVPVRSITCRHENSKLPSSPPVTTDGNSETIAYISASQLEAGPVCLRLSAELRANPVRQGHGQVRVVC